MFGVGPHICLNDELCAQNWLTQQGYRDIRRPSDDSPDFVVDGHYAVEVTRLNQRIVVGDNKRSKGEKSKHGYR